MSDLGRELDMHAGGHRLYPDLFTRRYFCERCQVAIPWEALREGVKLEPCQGRKGAK